MAPFLKPNVDDILFAESEIPNPETSISNKVKPTLTHQTEGYRIDEFPVREHENWLKNMYRQWASFYSQFLDFFIGQTIDSTETEIFINGVEDERLDILEDSNITFKATVNAIINNASESKSWKVEGTANKKGTNDITLFQIKDIISNINWDMNSIQPTIENSGVLSEESTPTSLVLSEDGMSVYIIGTNSDTIYQYPLKIPFNISSIGPTSGNSGSIGETATPTHLFFKPDGTEIYITDNNANRTYQYPLGTPWLISSIGATSGNTGVIAEDTVTNSISISNDGTELFILGRNNDTVYQYPLGTPWLISSIGATSGNTGVIAGISNPLGLRFSTDGSIIYLVSANTIFQYPLSTPWLASSIGLTSGNSGIIGEESTVASFFIRPDGGEVFLIGATVDTIFAYILDFGWNITFYADNTNNAIVPKVIGAAATTINWKIKFEKLENFS